jgi:hypothetical protein
MRSRQRRSQSSGYHAQALRKISNVNKIRKVSRPPASRSTPSQSRKKVDGSIREKRGLLTAGDIMPEWVDVTKFLAILIMLIGFDNYDVLTPH